MAEYPLVSIITPTLNSAKYLRETVDSVARQDYPNVEHLIVDGGSTDDTVSILKSYGNKVIWWQQAGSGQAAAINEGLKRSAAVYATWLGSDDTYLPGAISWAVAAFSRVPDAAVVFGDTVFTDPDSNPLFCSTAQGFSHRRMVVQCRNPIPQPSSFIRKNLLEAVDPLDESLHYFFDWDFWMRAGSVARFYYEPKLLSTYRLHAASKTAGGKCYAHELKQMYDKFFARPPLHLRTSKAAAYANMYSRSAEYYAAGGLRHKARWAKCLALWKGLGRS